jgi:hypothetical protein
MKVDAVEIYHVAMPLITPWTTAYGSDSVIESVLVKMTSGDTFAWGEACPLAAPTSVILLGHQQFVIWYSMWAHTTAASSRNSG